MADQKQSKDTGRDCPYCGGVIYRVENETGNVTTAFHNCKMCGARWSDSWSLTSPGNRGYNSRGVAQKEARERTPTRPFSMPSFDLSSINIPSWGWILIVVVGSFFLVRLGALSLLNLLLLPLTLIILGYIVFRIGKEQRWW